VKKPDLGFPFRVAAASNADMSAAAGIRVGIDKAQPSSQIQAYSRPSLSPSDSEPVPQ